MLQKIKEFINGYNIKDKTVLIGLSGGADSVCLCHVVSVLKNEFNLNVTGVHLNHNWREEESKLDAQFAKEFCKKINIGFYTEKLSDDIQKNETSARDARYEFYKKCKEKFNADCVFLAHNQNDNVETLIYRVIKGTGIDGMCSIPVHRDFYYRPLLNITRDEIENYINKNNLEYRFDKSNNDTKYKRNFIRHKILPLMKEINPTCMASINNLIKVCNLEAEIIDDKLNEIKQKIFKDDKIKTQEFIKLKSCYQIKLIQNYVKEDLKNPKFEKIKQIVDFINQTANEAQDPQYRKYKTFSLNAKLFLYVNKKEFFKGE